MSDITCFTSSSRISGSMPYSLSRNSLLIVSYFVFRPSTCSFHLSIMLDGSVRMFACESLTLQIFGFECSLNFFDLMKKLLELLRQLYNSQNLWATCVPTLFLWATFVARGSRCRQHLSLSSVYTCIQSRSTFFTKSSGLWMR